MVPIWSIDKPLWEDPSFYIQTAYPVHNLCHLNTMDIQGLLKKELKNKLQPNQKVELKSKIQSLVDEEINKLINGGYLKE